MNERLADKVAHDISREILEVIGSCLRPEERQDAYDEIVACVKAGIEFFELLNNRFERLIEPGRN
jgi:hypothetical protein